MQLNNTIVLRFVFALPAIHFFGVFLLLFFIQANEMQIVQKSDTHQSVLVAFFHLYLFMLRLSQAEWLHALYSFIAKVLFIVLVVFF